MADSFPPAIVSAKLLSAVGFYWQGDRREPTHLENQNKNQPENTNTNTICLNYNTIHESYGIYTPSLKTLLKQ